MGVRSGLQRLGACGADQGFHMNALREWQFGSMRTTIILPAALQAEARRMKADSLRETLARRPGKRLRDVR